MQIAIVGAGIMGRILALDFLNLGATVSLFDKDPVDSGGAAAYTAAGMLSPYCELESSEALIFKLGLASNCRWPSIVDELAEDVGYFSKGTLVTSHKRDRSEVDRFRKRLAFKLGVEKEKLPLLTGGELATLEPDLAEKLGDTLFLESECWLDSTKLMPALAKRLIGLGVDWHPETHIQNVDKLLTKKDPQFDWVFDCRGMGAKSDLSGLRAVRGETVHLQTSGIKIDRLVRLLHPRYNIYLIPRSENHYMVGATQIESEDYSEISVRSIMELLSAVYSIHPGFAEARIIKTEVNCRPALNDNLPSISVNDHIVRINGLFRHGFLLAPALADLVTSVVEGRSISGDFSGVIKYNEERL